MDVIVIARCGAEYSHFVERTFEVIIVERDLVFVISLLLLVLGICYFQTDLL